MTSKEFESYTRGIAYHVLRFKEGMINAEELYEAMLVQLGRDTFEAAAKIIIEKNIPLIKKQ